MFYFYFLHICVPITCLFAFKPYKMNRYKILAPAAVEKESDLKKCASAILEGAGLDPDKFRLGHTKAC